MRYLTLLALLVLPCSAAQALTFTYACKSKDQKYRYAVALLKIDDAKNVLTWKGKTFKIKIQEDCPRIGWHAERPGQSFDFCTATQGYADFDDNGASMECNQVVP